MTEDLYWRLHALSKILESSGRLDQHDHRDAYPAILDAMNALRAPQEAPGAGEVPTLPELPEPHLDVMRPGTHWFTADQMRAYGEACALAERERLNGVVQRQANLSLDTLEYLDGLVGPRAAAVHAGGPNVPTK